MASDLSKENPTSLLVHATAMSANKTGDKVRQGFQKDKTSFSEEIKGLETSFRRTTSFSFG